MMLARFKPGCSYYRICNDIAKRNDIVNNQILNLSHPSATNCTHFGQSLKRESSTWRSVPMGPLDPILGITTRYLQDPSPLKLDLGVGAYRDDQGKPFILPCVRKAEEHVFNAKLDHEYAPISGLSSFNEAASKLVFGKDSLLLSEKKVATVQCLSGTGALRIGMDFLFRFAPHHRSIHLPSPTWGNHLPLVRDAGFQIASYRYYNPKTIDLDEPGLLADIDAAPNGSIFLFHVCAHNPTGIDPSMAQWKKISTLCLAKSHFIFFDMAYQGFASGNPQLDASPIHQFIQDGHLPIITQSFAKNFGLYGERVGALHIVTNGREETTRIDSQLKILIRPHYSNPPLFGARIVSHILNNDELTHMWAKDLITMSGRIKAMRHLLVEQLAQAGSTRDWAHITKQIGMFCYSGLSEAACDKLAQDDHVYMTRNGRISMAGVTSSNVGYLAQAMARATNYE